MINLLFVIVTAIVATSYCSTAVSAQSPPSPVSFTAVIPPDHVSLPNLNFPILDCVGSGHGSLALRQDYREALQRVQRDIGFRHIRGHGLLDDDMSTFLDGEANLVNLFSVFDFYLSVGIRPIFEISFMPEALALDPSKTIMHYKGITSTYKNATAWASFITQVLSGLQARYGSEELRTWRFEVWNEPSAPCAFFCPAPGVTQLDGYFDLYNTTATAFQKFDPLLSIGGPATMQLQWVDEFIQRTGAGKNMPAHFISTHSYPTDYTASQMTRTLFEDNILSKAAEAEAAGLPLLMTEFAAGLTNNGNWAGATYFDDPFAAAFIVHTFAAFLGASNVPTLSYWTFSDVFEEGGFTSVAWANTYGIQTKYGVPKPAYRALEMLSKFPKHGVPLRGGSVRCNATATVGTVDIVTAIDKSLGTTWRLHALATNWNANVVDALNASAGLPISTMKNVAVTFEGVPKGATIPPTASVSIIDTTHGNAQPTWVASGKPKYPTQKEIDAEMQASLVIPVQLPLISTGSGVSVTLPDMIPYSVVLVIIEVAL